MTIKNTTKTVWIDTHRVTLCEMEGDFIYPMETMDQGRSATNLVGRYSILAGKPFRSESDNNARATVFAAYLALVLMAVLAAILYCWPTH